MGCGIFNIRCPFTSTNMLLGSAVKWESLTSSRGLLSPRSAFLSAGALTFFAAFVRSTQISVARMKSAAFLRASIREVSFYSAKENLKCPFFSLFRKEGVCYLIFQIRN